MVQDYVLELALSTNVSDGDGKGLAAVGLSKAPSRPDGEMRPAEVSLLSEDLKKPLAQT